MGDGNLAAELMCVRVRVAPQLVQRAAVRRSTAGEWGRCVRVRVRRQRLVGQRTELRLGKRLRGHLIEHLQRLGARRVHLECTRTYNYTYTVHLYQTLCVYNGPEYMLDTHVYA